MGEKVFVHVCDVTDKARVYELARKAVEEMGKVDILVNNAGYVMGGDFLEQPDEVWEKTHNRQSHIIHLHDQGLSPGHVRKKLGACGEHILGFGNSGGLVPRYVRRDKVGRVGADRIPAVRGLEKGKRAA